FFFSSRRRHTRFSRDWSSDVCSSDLKELEMSSALVSSFEADFDPDAHHDEYQEQLRTLIEAKIEQGDAIDTEATFGTTEEEPAEVLDLMEALRRSVEETRAKRSGGSSSKESGSGSGKKSTAKKSTSKKSTKTKKSA